MKNRKRRMVVGGLLLATVAGSGAYAYWTTSGSGTGSATTGTTANLTVSQTGTVTGIAPGSGSHAITGTITNGSTTPVNIASAVTVTIGTITGGGPSCEATDYTVSNGTAAATTVPASGSVNFSGASIAFNNKPAENQDDCKGATVNLAFAVTPAP